MAGAEMFDEQGVLEERELSQLDVVHIVMATYNGAAYLEEQIESLLGQTYKNITIEVCDDGSSDETCSMIQRYCEGDDRISLHRNEENLGYVKNFLEGIRRSSAPYIMLCDQDDIWDPDKVEVTLHAMKQEESVNDDVPVLVFTDAMNYNSDSGEETGRFHKTSHLDTKKVDTAHLFMENKCIGCTVMVNRQILPFLSRFPEEIRVHDWWLALICSHFGKIVYVDQPTLRYRQHGGNMIGGSSFADYVKNRLAGIAKQREALRQTFQQAGAFVKLYGDQMSGKQRECAEKFAGLENAGWLTRRKHMMQYGFTKSGFMRNVGLFFLI